MPKNRTDLPWERQKGESAQAFAAFLVYLQMGADRSLSAVGQRLGKSRALMERWSSANGWVERCRAWDNHLQREAKKAAAAEVRSMTRRHISIAQQIQGAAMQALKEMGSNMVNPKNFAAVVKFATDLERSSVIAEAEALGAAGREASERENNLLERIEESTAVEMDTHDIPEIESPADPGDDLVE